MADPERDEPSLELPSLGGGWRRRRRDRAAKAAEPAAETIVEPVVEPVVEPTPVSDEQATVAPAETMAEPSPPVVPDPEPAPSPARASGEQTTVLELPEVAEAPPVERKRRALPSVSLPGGWPAIVVTGLVVGLVVVGLTWASLRTCEQVQGTSTCGRAGYPMLALVLAVAVLVGAVLLRLTQVPDPVSTSLLGVGVAAVVALVFLIDYLDQLAMVVVIPVVCALTYAGSHWLTTAVIEPGGE